MMNVNWNHQSLRKMSHGGQSTPVVAPDTCFDQLESFHNDRLVLAHIGAALNDRGVVERCEILNVWYIFKRSLQVIYRVRFKNDAESDVILMVRFFPRGASSIGYQAALAGGAHRDAVLHLPSWDAVAWVFPADPELTHLPAMLDRHVVSQQLSQLPGGVPLDPDSMTWKLLSYLPGARCSILYRFAPATPIYVGKLQKGTLAAQRHRRLARLWESPQRRFRMPRPIGLDEALGARWESFVAGQRIEDIFSEVALRVLLAKGLRDLVNLHRLPMESLPLNGLEQILQRMGRNAMRRLRETLPPLEPAANDLYHTLERKAAALPERSMRTIHGDFHTANVLVDGEELIFIDLDNLARGDPAYDLALFGSRLLLIALHRGERFDEMAGIVADLPAMYVAAGGEEIPDPVFAWYMAALLVGRQIKTCMRHCAPALAQLAPACLTYARETLERDRFEAAIVGGT